LFFENNFVNKLATEFDAVNMLASAKFTLKVKAFKRDKCKKERFCERFLHWD